MLIRTARLHDHEHIRLCRIRLTGLERRGDRHVAQTLPKFSRSNTRRSRRVQAYALFRKVLREKICCVVNLVNWYHAKLFENPVFCERGLATSKLLPKVLPATRQRNQCHSAEETVLQSSESGLALQHAMKRRPRVTPRPRRRERGKSVEAEAGDEEGVGGEAEDGAVVVHLSLHPDEEGDDNNKDDAGEAIAQGEDDEGDEVGAKGGVAGGDAPKRGSSDALRQQVIDYKSTQERHESALEQIMKTLQEVEKGIVRKHPRDIERLKKSAETKSIITCFN